MQFQRRVWVRTIMITSLISMIGVFLVTPVAKAVLPVMDAPGQVGNIASREGLAIREEAKVGLEDSLLAAALGGLLEAASYFFRRLAYDTATYVASGGKGEGRLIFDNPGKYFSDVGGDAIASGIGELGKPFGLNLCQVPDLRVNLFLQIGLKQIYGQGPPQPNCRWQDLTSGGIFDPDAWDERYGSREKLADTFSTSLSVDNTDFGVALGAVAEVDRINAQAKEAALADQLVNDGFKPITSLISGDVLTPGQTVQEETKKLTATHQGEVSSQQIAGIYGAGALQIIPSAMSVFLNTLTSQVLQQILTKGLFPDSGGGRGSEAINMYAEGIADNRIAAQAAYNKLFTSVPSKQLTDYDIISEFAACPDRPGLNNCVIDTDLQRALVQASTGNPLTIKEALEQGLLHGEWQLISPRREAEHTNVKGCQVGKYCYSNIQKMRKVRILPMGFEVAALRSDPDNPWTLQRVVDNFETCRRDDAGNVIPDSRFPFCHLINPNWILRSPVVRCESKVFSELLISNETPERREECTDFSTCLFEGGGSNCNGSQYAYCTKEKNIWRIGAKECPAEFNTCLTYQNTENNNKIVSYLTKTLDFGQCSESAVGCRALSLEQTNSAWVPSVTLHGRADELERKHNGRNQVVYFNKQIYPLSGDCTSEKSDGCHAFFAAAIDEAGQFVTRNDAYVKTDVLAHLKKAPEYLGCYDTNRNTANIEWPRTSQEARNLVSNDPACDVFASVCAPEEVGCEAFVPEHDKEPVIPGIIGANNVCPQICSGYDTFKQVGYREAEAGFEESEFPLHFIPGNAQQCSAELVGCDEFTNIDARERGGEALEYYSKIRYCERPQEDGSNVKTYYSWEGSVADGFELKTYRFLPIDAEELAYINALNVERDIPNAVPGVFGFSFPVGSPAYADDNREALLDAFRKCNRENYQQRLDNPYHPDAADPNCRAIFDDSGAIQYRLIDELVTVSEACHRIRKTEPNLVRDFNLDAADECRAKDGFWDLTIIDGGCMRCSNGGAYESGSCVYETIAAESRSCRGPEGNSGLYAGCRAYVGNAGRNIETVVDDDFEAASETPDALLEARGRWSGPGAVQVAAEAIDVGGHSLHVTGAGFHRTFLAGELKTGASYELTFWLRGESGAMEIEFYAPGRQAVAGIFTKDAATGQNRSISFGTSWQEYRLGPVEFTGTQEEEIQLAFYSHGRELFIDHVQLKRLPDNIYLVKDSWKTPDGQDVPSQCDSHPEDGLPGEMLGCKPYTVKSTGQVRYATGFTQLCRPKAIGCQPFWDTQNTVSGQSPELTHVYNVWCTGQPGVRCQVKLENDAEVGSCIVPPAGTGCYVSEVIIPNIGSRLRDAHVVTSTVYIPKDTSAGFPIFLADREEFRCRESERGCTKVGLEKQEMPDVNAAVSYSHRTIMVKNDPALYSEILCRDDLVGCGAYRAGNETQYFKDPELTGNSLCYFKPASGYTIDEVYGWFKQGVGKCARNAPANADGLCRTNSDCGEGDRAVCESVGSIECHDGNFVRAGGFSDIHSNGDVAYKGLVGVCEAQYSQCTELIDPADTDERGNSGKPYYVIYNDKVEEKIEQCKGRVSLSEGCVLFDKTDEPNKRFDSAATYAASEAANPKYSAVLPVNRPATNDANIILKVERDRACSEWLACKSSIPHVGEDGRKLDLCYEYAACNKTEPGKTCTNWVTNSCNPDAGNKRLTYENYITRRTSWYDEEYVGYSLFDKYQISDLAYFSFNPSSYDSLKVGGRVQEQYRAIEAFVGFRQAEAQLPPALGCEVTEGDDAGSDKPDWTVCGVVEDGTQKGRCYRGQCIYPIHKPFSDGVQDESDVSVALGDLEPNSCKGYPEKDSPFPTEVGGEPTTRGERKEFTVPPNAFTQAYFCQDGNCSCSYKKLFFEDGSTDYWSQRSLTEGRGQYSGVCISGNDERRGFPCNEPADCGDGDDAICARKEKTESHIGFEGFCLERDLSRPINGQSGKFACLTWLPIEVSASGADLFNADTSAGYQPDQDDVAEGFGKAYCVAATQVASQPHEFAGVTRPDRGGRQVPVLDLLVDDAANLSAIWERFIHDPAQWNDRDIYDEWARDVTQPLEGLWELFTTWSDEEWPPSAPNENDDDADDDVGLPPERWPRPAGVSDDNWENHPAWVSFLEEKKQEEFLGRDDWHELDDIEENFLAFVDGELGDNPNYFWVGPQGRLEPDLHSRGYGHPDWMGGRSCREGGDERVKGDYRNLICDNPDPQLLAALVQHWTWRDFNEGGGGKPNMIVLRAEQQADWWQSFVCDSNNDGIVQAGEICQQRHSFGGSALDITQGEESLNGENAHNPLANRLLITALLAYADPTDPRSPRSLGTIMHPPRDFGRGKQAAFSAFRYAQEGKIIHSILLSPGPLLQAAGQVDREHERVRDSLWRSNAEAFIRKQDIHRLYFVPTAIMGGLFGNVLPPMFTDDFFIDFTLLDNAAGHENISLVWRTIFCHKNARGSDAGEEFPRLFPNHDPGGCEGKHGRHFTDPSVPKAALWTYKQTNTNEIYGYANLGNPEGRLAEEDLLEDERNRIAERYVAVYFNPTLVNPFTRVACMRGNCDLNLQSLNELPAADPFRADCDPGEIDSNWFAIGLDFNSDGEFLGYVSRYCNKDTPAGAPQLAVIAELNDQCTEFAKVFDPSPEPNELQGTTNKAWTNRVWAGALTPDGEDPMRHPTAAYGNGASAIHRETQLKPYGSLEFQLNEDDDIVANNAQALRNRAFRSAISNGIPYSCTERYMNLTYYRGPGQARCEALTASDPGGYPEALAARLSGKNVATAKAAVEQLFAKVFNYVRFDTTNPSLLTNLYDVSEESVDHSQGINSAIAGERLMPPQIYSLNPWRCFSSETRDGCTAGEKHNVTVNGKNGTETDYDQDGLPDEVSQYGEPDVIIGEGTQRVTINFFAFADDNRMPIRRVRVKWGGGGPADRDLSPDKVGLYKNRKPFCEETDDPGVNFDMGMCDGAAAGFDQTGLTCVNAARKGECPADMACISSGALKNAANAGQLPPSYAIKRFGNTPGACKEGYFEFTHEYVCDSADRDNDKVWRTVDSLSPGTKARLIARGLTVDKHVCVYKPGVTVTDNWEHCNGSVHDAGVLRLDENGDPVPATGYFGNMCTNFSSAVPWTYYKGEIVVIPQEEDLVCR